MVFWAAFADIEHFVRGEKARDAGINQEIGVQDDVGDIKAASLFGGATAY